MIFYFSGTGNTKWAAERLAEITGEELLFIPEIAGSDCHFLLQEDERIGFCFPVHGWRPPFLVREFIKNLTFENAQGHYCYILCTAGDTIGETVRLFQKDLSEIGLHADSVCSLIMPESYVGLPFMDVDKPDKERQKKEAARKRIETFADCVLNRKKGYSDLTIGHWPRINSRIIGGYFLNHLITDEPFKVTTDKCIKCGLCSKVCPVKNIDFKNDNIPSWKHNGKCLTCFACYHHCPNHAIEFGRQTQKKGQYYYNKQSK